MLHTVTCKYLFKIMFQAGSGKWKFKYHIKCIKQMNIKCLQSRMIVSFHKYHSTIINAFHWFRCLIEWEQQMHSNFKRLCVLMVQELVWWDEVVIQAWGKEEEKRDKISRACAFRGCMINQNIQLKFRKWRLSGCLPWVQFQLSVAWRAFSLHQEELVPT